MNHNFKKIKRYVFNFIFILFIFVNFIKSNNYNKDKKIYNNFILAISSGDYYEFEKLAKLYDIKKYNNYFKNIRQNFLIKAISQYINTDNSNYKMSDEQILKNNNLKKIIDYLIEISDNDNKLLDNVDETQKTPLFYAVLKNNNIILKKILDKKKNLSKNEADLVEYINRKDKIIRISPFPFAMEDKVISRKPAIFYSIVNEYIDILKLLIEYGADVNIKDDIDFSTPLMWAFSIETHKDNKQIIQNIVKILLENNANIYSKNISGKTVLDMLDNPSYKKKFLRKIFKNMKINGDYYEDK